MDNKEIRRKNMLLLAKHYGGLKALGEHAKVSPIYLSNIKNGATTKKGVVRGMGDKVARRLEDKCDKPKGWIDRQNVDIASVGGDRTLLRLIEHYLAVEPERQLSIAKRAESLFNEQFPGTKDSAPFFNAPGADVFIQQLKERLLAVIEPQQTPESKR